MAERHPSIKGSFYKRGGATYHYYGYHGGERVRCGTGCQSLDDAARWMVEHLAARGEIPELRLRQILSWTKRRAAEKGLEFTLTLNDIQHMLARGGGKCEVSGIFFSDKSQDGARRRPYAPSIDRIRCDQGYTAGNCRLVCAAVNLAMNDFGVEVLRRIALSMRRRPQLRHSISEIEC